MTAALALAAWSALAATSEVDCSEVSPEPSPNPDAARAYLEVGNQELLRGQGRTALLAFRSAVRLDPSSAVARSRLAMLCQPPDTADQDLDNATRAIEENRPEEAVRLLGPRYRSRAPPVAITTLLYGIALYESGDEQGAWTALEQAAAVRETRDAAVTFLGLLELRSGNAERAAALFDRASSASGSELASTARDLSILARKGTRLAVNVQAEAGYGSRVNPTLYLPSMTPASDLFYGAAVSTFLRPFGERGPYATVGAWQRNLLHLNENNFSWLSGIVGFRSGGGPTALRVEYAYEAMWLGGAPFLSAHQLRADGRVELGGARLGSLLSARAETYLRSALARYTGATLEGELSADLRHGGSALWLLYRGQLHRAFEEADSWLEHGPGLRGSCPLFSGRLALTAQLAFRVHGGPEPGLDGAVRSDTYLDGTISFEQELNRWATLFLSINGRRTFSNVPGLEYTRVAGSAGTILTAGLW